MSCQQIGVHNNMKFDCSIVLLGEFCFSMILSGNWNMKDSPQDFSTFWRYGKFLIDGLIDCLLACFLACLVDWLNKQKRNMKLFIQSHVFGCVGVSPSLMNSMAIFMQLAMFLWDLNTWSSMVQEGTPCQSKTAKRLSIYGIFELTHKLTGLWTLNGARKRSTSERAFNSNPSGFLQGLSLQHWNFGVFPQDRTWAWSTFRFFSSHKFLKASHCHPKNISLQDRRSYPKTNTQI